MAGDPQAIALLELTDKEKVKIMDDRKEEEKKAKEEQKKRLKKLNKGEIKDEIEEMKKANGGKLDKA